MGEEIIELTVPRDVTDAEDMTSFLTAIRVLTEDWTKLKCGIICSSASSAVSCLAMQRIRVRPNSHPEGEYERAICGMLMDLYHGLVRLEI